MPKVAFLIVASPNAGFYSQIAAINLAVKSLSWGRWEPEIFVAMGSRPPVVDAEDSFERWRAHLREVNFSYVSETAFASANNWAQVELRLLLAPRNADVYIAIDADTLPVADLVDVLEEIYETNLIGGVMAHFPPPGLPDIDAWRKLATRIGAKELEFSYEYSLVRKDAPEEIRKAPIYVNAGVMLFSCNSFELIVRPYVALMLRLIETLPAQTAGFSFQIALPFVMQEAGLRGLSLPMRYNYPNDERAASLHPKELEKVVIFHYLRTQAFDRRKLFTNAKEYEVFLGTPMTGINLAFQNCVRRLIGDRYPFQ